MRRVFIALIVLGVFLGMVSVLGMICQDIFVIKTECVERQNARIKALGL
jgi:hypothetical protein